MAGTIGKGSSVKYDVAGTPTSIPGTFDIDGPDGVYDIEESTTNDSPGTTKEKLVVLEDPGEVNFMVLWSKTVETTLMAQKGLTKEWEVHYPDGSKIECATAALTKVGRARPTQGKIAMPCTVSLLGAYTYTPAA